RVAPVEVPALIQEQPHAGAKGRPGGSLLGVEDQGRGDLGILLVQRGLAVRVGIEGRGVRERGEQQEEKQPEVTHRSTLYVGPPRMTQAVAGPQICQGGRTARPNTLAPAHLPGAQPLVHPRRWWLSRKPRRRALRIVGDVSSPATATTSLPL